MQLNIKSLQDIMRNDAGVNGDAQRMEQIAWILFLKMYDCYEKKWATDEILQMREYNSILPDNLKWDAWAKDNGKQTKTGEELLNFVNAELFPTLKKLTIDEQTPLNKSIVKKAFEDTNNYMKDGYLLREIINTIDKLSFESKEDKEEIHQVYESFLKILQSAGNAGEFYTPRALTDAIMRVLKPTPKDKIADFACGTGGFFTSAFYFLEEQKLTAQQKTAISQAFFGIEKKSLPFILCATNFLINGIEVPNLKHGNAFDYFVNFSDLATAEKFDIIAMNPPYGGNEKQGIANKFPRTFRSSETADLFLAIIIERLKENGKAAVVLPDGLLFGDDTPKINLKKRLLNECDLNLILRLPSGVFAPYTSIATNVLFFTKTLGGTKQTHFYRLDMPDGIKSFSKTKPMNLSHFEPFWQWDKAGRADLQDENGNFKAKSFSKAELEARNYNFDLCGFVSEQEQILEPFELITQIKNERERLNATLDSLMSQISQIIKENE